MLEPVRKETLFMGERTYMWIDVTEYVLAASGSPEQIIAAVIGSADYSETFDVTIDGETNQSTIHFNWSLDEISPSIFISCPSTEAEEILQDWADNQRWTDPGYRQSAEAQARLMQTREILRSGDVYRLQTPMNGDRRLTTYGLGGFYEFIVIDEPGARAYLIVATDD